jgi:ATP-dependent helicase/nuclease subunit A
VLYVAMTRAKEHLVLVGTTGESAVDQWRSRWNTHTGPMPADAILGARTMLDWIGPVAAAMQGAGKIEIEFIPHAGDEVAAWPDPQQLRPPVTPRQAAMSRLLPLDPPPPHDAAADAIIQRLTTPYAHAPFAALPASVAVSALTKEGRLAPGGDSPSLAGVVPFGRTLPIPRGVSTEPSATDVGSATHFVLQHLDFTRPCDAADVRDQIDQLLARRLLSPAMAAAVGVGAIAWLAASSVGQLLRRHAHRMRRELPVYFPLEPGELGMQAADALGLDRVMARGRVDVLVETDAGLEVVDYKTDQVTAETVAARAEFYEPQVKLYRRTVEAATGRVVANLHLVFLAARVIRSL